MAAEKRVGSMGVHVGLLAESALVESRLSHKEAALTCGVDPAHWRRMLDGERAMDLWKLRHLPIRFWQAFLPLFVSALIRCRLQELEADHLRMRNVPANWDGTERRKRA